MQYRHGDLEDAWNLLLALRWDLLRDIAREPPFSEGADYFHGSKNRSDLQGRFKSWYKDRLRAVDSSFRLPPLAVQVITASHRMEVVRLATKRHRALRADAETDKQRRARLAMLLDPVLCGRRRRIAVTVATERTGWRLAATVTEANTRSVAMVLESDLCVPRARNDSVVVDDGQRHVHVLVPLGNSLCVARGTVLRLFFERRTDAASTPLGLVDSSFYPVRLTCDTSDLSDGCAASDARHILAVDWLKIRDLADLVYEYVVSTSPELVACANERDKRDASFPEALRLASSRRGHCTENDCCSW